MWIIACTVCFLIAGGFIILESRTP